MKRMLSMLFYLVLFLVNSCGSKHDNSNKFLGKWQLLEQKTTYITISKDGDNLILEQTLTDVESKFNRTPPKRFIATYNKLKDKFEISTDMGSQELNYVESSKNMFIGSQELRRIE